MSRDAAAGATPAPPVRLLIVNSTLHIGGAEQVAADLARSLDCAAFEVSACYLKQPGTVAEQMLRSGVDLVPVPGLVPGRRDYLTSLKLRRLIRQRRIDLIHTHDIHGLIDGAACRLTVPGLRLVHTFHYGNYPERRTRHRIIEGLLWRVPDALVAVSHAQADSIRRFYHIPEDRLRVIWNGVAEPRPAHGPLRLAWPIPPGTPVIASISTLIRQKGIEDLLEAAAELRDSGDGFVLLIAGDGVLRESLAARVAALDLGRHVQFLGWIPEAANHVLPACDVFVQSSIWEAMSIVVLEAMAAGRPMVVTAVGENPRVVDHGVSGLTVPPSDPTALAGALRRVLRDSALREQLGRAARRRYEQLFTVAHMARSYEQLYRQVAGRRE